MSHRAFVGSNYFSPTRWSLLHLHGQLEPELQAFVPRPLSLGTLSTTIRYFKLVHVILLKNANTHSYYNLRQFIVLQWLIILFELMYNMVVYLLLLKPYLCFNVFLLKRYLEVKVDIIRSYMVRDHFYIVVLNQMNRPRIYPSFTLSSGLVDWIRHTFTINWNTYVHLYICYKF